MGQTGEPGVLSAQGRHDLLSMCGVALELALKRHTEPSPLHPDTSARSTPVDSGSSWSSGISRNNGSGRGQCAVGGVGQPQPQLCVSTEVAGTLLLSEPRERPSEDREAPFPYKRAPEERLVFALVHR
ncbi:hypothetical protein HispidOSU_018884 [Sigmodon hispidus]